MASLPWLLFAGALVALLGTTLVLLRPRGAAPLPPLPAEWALTPRPVFGNDERRVYRLLREALPHHVVLAKLPLVRFCQPSDVSNVRYWYDLLGAHHVAFAVCSANGRVLAAIDLESDRANSRRVMQIKQAVLSACRVRYLRCAPHQLPTLAELQLLLPQSGHTQQGLRGPHAAPPPSEALHEARDTLATTVAARRAERTALWQDSSFFQDSFFAADPRLDGLGPDFEPIVPPTRH
jgi:hypothetical protein